MKTSSLDDAITELEIRIKELKIEKFKLLSQEVEGKFFKLNQLLVGVKKTTYCKVINAYFLSPTHIKVDVEYIEIIYLDAGPDKDQINITKLSRSITYKLDEFETTFPFKAHKEIQEEEYNVAETAYTLLKDSTFKRN